MKPSSAFQTVKVEIVRPGGAHNQLLSPYTSYVALCGDQGPANVHLRWEHWRWLRALRGLRYDPDTSVAERMHDLRETQGEMAHLISQVPALLSEVSSERPVCLRLVLTPAELAMLPFEAALAPAGMAGEGRELLVDTEHTVVVTREVRTGTPRDVVWPSDARILVIAAQPAGYPPVPLDAHMLALRRALAPWEGPREATDGVPGAVEPLVLDHRGRPILCVLQQATLDGVRQAIIDGVGASAGAVGAAYTHVHVLAHGAPTLDGERFGLALCDRAGQPTVLDGEQLASALRARIGLPGPSCVVLATCDSGAVKDVMFPAVNLAHALHVAGIPLVVGSQFPLTARGSVRLTKAFYEGVLAGWDPLWALAATRRELFRHHDSSHDWASVVAYTRFPSDHRSQMTQVRFDRIRESLWAASAWANQAQTAKAEAKIAAAIGRMARWETEEAAWLDAVPMRRIDLAGRHGGAVRRQAQLALTKGAPDCRRLLRAARALYRKGVDVAPQHPWTTAQFLSMGVILGDVDEDAALLWGIAWRAARPGPAGAVAAADLLELALLAIALDAPVGEKERIRATQRCVSSLREDADAGGYAMGLVLEQLDRYLVVWTQLPRAQDGRWKDFLAEADRVRAALIA